MDSPQAQIPHRMVNEGAGHVAKRTEVRANSNPRNNDLRTILRGVKMIRDPILSKTVRQSGSDGYSTGRRSYQKSDCSNCGATTNSNSVGSHSGAESEADDSIHRRWASSNDIFRAYSDPVRSRGNAARFRNNPGGTGSLRGNSMRVSPHSKPHQHVRFASVRGSPRNDYLQIGNRVEDGDDTVCIDLCGTTPRTLSLDRGLNRIGNEKLRFFQKSAKDQKPKKRVITAAFSLPLQTLHENRPLADSQRPDEDFGFNPAKKMTISKPMGTISKVTMLQSTLNPPKKDRKVPRNTKRIVTDENVKTAQVKPSQVSSIRFALAPKSGQKSNRQIIAGKVKFWTTKLSMKERIEKEISEQDHKEHEYLSMHVK